MNSDNIFESLQKGFRVTLGATTSLIESLQDEQKRERNLNLLRSDLSTLVQEYAEKGTITEMEARNFVDSIMLSQQRSQSPASTTSVPVDISDTMPAAPPNVQLDLQELTAQIAAIRVELEKLRNQDSSL